MRSESRAKALLAFAFSAACAVVALVGTYRAVAGPMDPLNPFGGSTNIGPVTPEEKARREQMRNELYTRYAADYRMPVPFISEASITAIEAAIARYQQIAAAGGWPIVGDNATLRPGDTSGDVATIRKHLMIEGDLPQGNASNPNFDAQFQEGLARFQIRNGQRVSGFVDSRTLAALNVPVAERVRQLQTNLVRVKELMKINQAPRYVLVNVPAFVAQAVEKGNLALDSNVVAGKPARATPEVSARIVEVNFFPTWTVPEIVAQQDLIPKIRKDPSYFANEHFSVMRDWKAKPLDPATVDWNAPEVVNYRFRQDPGTFNALGVVRINMPNKHSVYMHDTPLKQLFSQSVRAFSSGCVRVERVLDLVAWLLAPVGWTPERVQNAASDGARLDVKVKAPVPVHFVYLTAFATPNGVVEFRPDIYGRDGVGEGADDPRDAVVAQQRTAVTP